MVFGLSWHVKCVCDVGNCIDCGDDGIFGCGSSVLFRSIFKGRLIVTVFKGNVETQS